ncbi:ganglioside GM2 activator-like [Pomacea canaliculata]|uniref:ganglioside GM2 activator-like n=1 Tax=Pomacea canaliculata TaxID=400727 RepID=UPI000D72D2C7|nr:ganglioside GM2 activator-like [Pomacea canaliculata]
MAQVAWTLVNWSSPKQGKIQPAWLKSFKVTNCSEEKGKQSTFVIRSLEVSPDPLALPGIVTVHFEINNLLDISDSDDVQISVDMDLTRGGTTVKIPCLDMFGSCTYNDVCSLLAPIETCPPEFMESNVPCKCPINKADYILQQVSANVGISFPPGDYSATANMTLNGLFAACINVTFTVE